CHAVDPRGRTGGGDRGTAEARARGLRGRRRLEAPTGGGRRGRPPRAGPCPAGFPKKGGGRGPPPRHHRPPPAPGGPPPHTPCTQTSRIFSQPSTSGGCSPVSATM